MEKKPVAIIFFVLALLVACYFAFQGEIKTFFVAQSKHATTTPEVVSNESGLRPLSVAWTPLTSNSEGVYNAATGHKVVPLGNITSGKYAGGRIAAEYPLSEGATLIRFIETKDGKKLGMNPCEYYGGDDPSRNDCTVYVPDLVVPSAFKDAAGVSYSFYNFYGDLVPPLSVPLENLKNAETFKKVSADGKGRPIYLAPNRRFYYIKLADGSFVELEPDSSSVLLAAAIPNVTWRNGRPALAEYSGGRYVYGIEDCFDAWDDIDPIKDFVVTGAVTTTGVRVYEPDPEVYSSSYECMYEKVSRPQYDGEEALYKGTFAEFQASHPLFFWVDAHGAQVPFVSRLIVPAAEKAKPVIYLYPKEISEVSVDVRPLGGFTKTIPEYGNGWDVIAQPSGTIINKADGAAYPYLFWEGGGAGVTRMPEDGFVVSKENVGAALEEKLALYGLSEKEIYDFTEFWVPKLSKAPYYFITFVSREDIDRTAPLGISPQPDTTIRVLMDYKPLQALIDVRPLQIKGQERKGFTVVEWGGVLRD